MNEKGDPLKNFSAERVNGILKTELLEETYHSFEQVKNSVALAVGIYNHPRPHNSVSDLSPFEVHSLRGTIKPNRLWKNNYKLKAKEVRMELVWFFLKH